MAVASVTAREPLLERPIDLVHLARVTLGDRALEHEVLGLFVRQTLVQLERLKHAGSPDAFRIAAHTLKGSAQSVGAPAVAALALEAEEAGAAPQAERTALVARIEARVAEAHLYISGILAGDRV